MSSKRRSYEAGHKRKYLVVIDDTEECDRAVYWAAKRAGRTKSQIVMLRVIEPGDRNQQWLGVADIMMAEQQEAANAALDKFAARAKKIVAPKMSVEYPAAVIMAQIACCPMKRMTARYKPRRRNMMALAMIVTTPQAYSMGPSWKFKSP